MSLKSPSNFNEPDSLDLQSQLEELKGLLRANNLLLKDQEFKHKKEIENYELQLSKLNDDNKQLKERYDKILDAQRKLEKLNSNLEEKLLNIVVKYENEQKTLLEELTIAHSKVVEAKLTIDELEKEKDVLREDCNLAVNLLQCKPDEFVSHSYNSLPVSLKERLKPLLTAEELIRLESDEDDDADIKKQNSSIKIPAIQPTAAAAMMYNIQLNQRERTTKTNRKFDESCSLSDSGQVRITNDGKVSSSLIADLLKKDSSSKSKMSFKLFPYVCLRCKKEVILCDSPSQTSSNDSETNNDSKILNAIPRSILNDLRTHKSKSIGSKLCEMTQNTDFDSNNLNKLMEQDKSNSVGRLQII